MTTQTTPELIMPEYVSLKDHPTINERWLQDRLSNNPELLRLPGELEVRSSERRQPSGGRLDLLLEDVESGTRYEVEIQLGAMDESHIIRTIEYWDIERRRYPQYEHVAVIVAEDVTSRFLNVISLLNGAIPLIAVQIKGVEVNGSFTLISTRVVDVVQLGTEDEDVGETVDRSSWDHKSSALSLGIMDNLLEMVAEVEPGVKPRYTKNYIGLEYDGQARNFVSFKTRQVHVIAEFKIPQDDRLTSWLNETELSVLKYNRQFKQYRLQVRQTDIDEHRDDLIKLIREARDAYGGS